MDKKKDRLLEHDYDGIQELDNDLPPWWLWLFYISIVYGVIYMIHYHVTGTGDLSAVEYMKEMNPNRTEAQGIPGPGMSLGYQSPFAGNTGEMTPQMWAAFENYVGPKVEFQTLVMEAMRRATADDQEKLKTAFPDAWKTLTEGGGSIAPAQAAPLASAAANLNFTRLTDAASLDAGQRLFVTNCASCHGAEGQGGIGPNMTDNYYIHGGQINQLAATIINGVPIKGMISWKGILTDEQINQVASYMMSLRGTNPPNPKAPQGDLVEFPEDAVTTM